MSSQTATHCIVFARLLIDGQDHGVHNFIVPLRYQRLHLASVNRMTLTQKDRDMNTGRLLPGVTIGDVGSKWGRHVSTCQLSYHSLLIDP